LSRIRIKLWRSLRLYNPAKGTAFSFCAKVISSTAPSAVGEPCARNGHFCPLDEATDTAAGRDAGIDKYRFGERTSAASVRQVCRSVLGRWEKQEKAADEKTLVLLGRFSGNPDVEKARVEFERAQEDEETFHKDFDGINVTTLPSDWPRA
jgi:hypothetical protein